MIAALPKFILGTSANDEQPLNIVVNAAVPVVAVVSNAGTDFRFTHPFTIEAKLVTETVLKGGNVLKAGQA